MQSKKSLLRLIFLMQCTQIQFRSMLTLTYPRHYPRDGLVVKQDVAAAIAKVKRAGLKYLWFLEFQKRGAPHVHVLTTLDTLTPKLRVQFGLYWTERIATSDWYIEACPPDQYDKETIKMAKFNCHPSVWEIIRHEDGARNYVSKYASKERQKRVPRDYANVGRFWGSSRDLRPKGIEFDITEADVERWLIDNGHPAAAWYLVPRYMWGVGANSTGV